MDYFDITFKYSWIFVSILSLNLLEKVYSSQVLFNLHLDSCIDLKNYSNHEIQNYELDSDEEDDVEDNRPLAANDIDILVRNDPPSTNDHEPIQSYDAARQVIKVQHVVQDWYTSIFHLS